MADDNSGFDWSTLIGPAAAVGTGLIGRALTPSPQQATQAQIPPELRTLLGMGVQRTQYQNPLFQATSNQAFQGLPAYAREGLSMPSNLPAMPTSAAANGDPSSMLAQLLKYLAAGGAGYMAGKAGSGGNMDIGKLLSNIFGGHGSHENPNNFFEGPQDFTQFTGPTWDFADWAGTNHQFNPEANPWESPDWSNLPGAQPGPDPNALFGSGTDPNLTSPDWGGGDW